MVFQILSLYQNHTYQNHHKKVKNKIEIVKAVRTINQELLESSVLRRCPENTAAFPLPGKKN